MSAARTIAYFVTPHGFGHASRASAVMKALGARSPGCRFMLLTTVPEIFFRQSGIGRFEYHALAGDVGMVQPSPLVEDLAGTCDRLDQMLPFDDVQVHRLADLLSRQGCDLVICDIAAIGIAAASRAGIPSVLLENFTWDWIYGRYTHLEPRFKPHQSYLAGVYARADHHIQTQPLCRRRPGVPVFGPISRRPRQSAQQTRRRLGLPQTGPVVLLSMGGIADTFQFLNRLPDPLPFHLVIPGADGFATDHDNITLLETHSGHYHPDLLAAADVLIGKAGYSTVAEACLCGIPFGYVKRPRSPESPALEAFIAAHLPSEAISEAAYASGRWVAAAVNLLGRGRGNRIGADNADAVARHICTLSAVDRDPAEPMSPGAD